MPVIATNLVPTTGDNVIANADAINSMIQIIPLLLVVAVIIGIIGMFLYSRKA